MFIPIIIIVTPVFISNAWAADMSGESHNSKAYLMEEIVVTATREAIPKQDIAANITVITQKDIANMPASNAAEVLQYVPGVYVEINGGLGSYATARIQGSEVRHVAIYKDGVPLNQLANPMADLSGVSVDDIDRIEIYKGAASSAWGSSLGGVINILTKKPDPKKPVSIDVRTSYGEHNTMKNRGSISGKINRLGYLLSLTHNESEGVTTYSDFKQDAAYAKLNWEFGETSAIGFIYSYDEWQKGDPVLNYADFWDDINQRRTYQHLIFETEPADNLGFTFEGRHHQFDILVYDIYQDDTRDIYNDYEDEIWGMSARMRWDISNSNTFNLGLDSDWGTYDWIYYTKEYDTRNSAVYVNDSAVLGKFSFNAGLRYDDNEDFGSEISPSAGAVWHILDNNLLARAQIARGFSAPPASWVHDPTYGNPDLEPEIAVSYQLGAEMRFIKILRLEINFFKSDIEDLIRYNPDTERYENIDSVTRQGTEGSIGASFDCGLTLSFGGSYTDVRDENTDEIIKDIPRTEYNLSAIYAHHWMSHSLKGRYIDHNSSYPETCDQTFVFDYLLNVNLASFIKYGKPGLYFAAYNVFDSDYLYRSVWPQPDRWIEGGIRFEF